MGRAIIEPGGEFSLEFLGPYHPLLAKGGGLPAALMSSWELVPEYLDVSITYRFHMESMYARMAKQRAAMEAEESGATTEETEDVKEHEEKRADKRGEPSEHAKVRDWASFECSDYAAANCVNM